MKNHLIALCAMLLSLGSLAQKDSTRFVEIGVNASRLLTQFGNLSQSDQNIYNPYTLTLEWKPTVIGFRAGFGHADFTQTELPGTANGNSTYKRDSVQTNMRFGLVLYKSFNPHWSMKYGVDYINGKHEVGTESTIKDINNNDVTSTSRTVRKESGVSPFLYVQYHFSKHVSIGTELLMSFTSFKSTETLSSTDFPTFSTTKEKEGNSFAVRAPTALFLVVRF